MLVSSKNSGTHWLKYMLSIALAETYGTDWPRYYSEAGTAGHIGSPKNREREPGIPKLAFSHTIPHRLMDWPFARSTMNLPRYVLLIRHPAAILASHYAKWKDALNVSWETYLRGDPSGKTYRCDIFWIARFWARWSKLIDVWPDGIRIIRYEEIHQSPITALKSSFGQWEINVDDEALETAIKQGSKEEMSRRADPDGEQRVVQTDKRQLADLFSNEAGSIYAESCQSLFQANLGYDLLDIQSAI